MAAVTKAHAGSVVVRAASVDEGRAVAGLWRELWDAHEAWGGYAGTRDSADLTRKYERLLQRVYELKEKPGLSAAVYTQTTDVETECNGLLTYDRAMTKIAPEILLAANRGMFDISTEAAAAL